MSAKSEPGPPAVEPAGRPTRILGYATGEVRGHEVELVVRVGDEGECAEDEERLAEGKGRVARDVEQRYNRLSTLLAIVSRDSFLCHRG